jgi:hypothetical protein
MRQEMEADVVFVSEHHPMRPAEDPRDHPGIATLIKHGFDVEVLDDSIEYWGDLSTMIEAATPTFPAVHYEWVRKIYIQARITIEVDEEAREPDGDFLDWVGDIVEPFGGDPIEAGFADPRIRWRYRMTRNN